MACALPAAVSAPIPGRGHEEVPHIVTAPVRSLLRLSPGDELRLTALSALAHVTAMVWGELNGDRRYGALARRNLARLASQGIHDA
jgi:hypothetical protein